MPLLGAVDGIVIVARVGHTRVASARRLLELLQHTPSAPVLGVVANAVSPADIRKYGIQAEAGQDEARIAPQADRAMNVPYPIGL